MSAAKLLNTDAAKWAAVAAVAAVALYFIGRKVAIRMIFSSGSPAIFFHSEKASSSS